MSQEYTPEQIRTAFEDQMRSVWWGDSFHAERHPKAPDEYLKAPEQMAWIGWQAADAYAATLRQQAARVDDLDAAADRLGDYLVREQAVYLSHKSLRAALEAALSAQPAEPVLDADARIGHMVFRKGVRWSTVIGAAQRQFKYHEAQPAERQEEAIHVNATDDDGSILYVYPPIAKRGDKLYLHPAAPVGVPDGWTDATTPPDVSKGQDKYFWIAVRRNGNDKVYVFPAVYANAYQLCCSDDEPCAVSGPFWAQQPSEEGDEGDIEITGWYDIKSNSEYDSYYTPVCSKGDVVVAWHKGPEFADAPSAPQGVE